MTGKNYTLYESSWATQTCKKLRRFTCYSHGICTNGFNSQTHILYINFGCLVLQESSKLKNSIHFQWHTFNILQIMQLRGFNKNTFELVKSAVCHLAIQNYSSNYNNYYEQMFYCKFIEIIIRYSLLWFFVWWLHNQNYQLTCVWSVCISCWSWKTSSTSVNFLFP